MRNLFFISLFTVFLGPLSYAQKTCQSLLSEDPKIDIAFDQAEYGQTVVILKSRPGRFGGQNLVLEKDDKGWLSGAAPSGFNPQGDPRWFMWAFEKPLQDFFGFELSKKEDEIHVPDSLDFVGGVKRLNESLQEKSLEPTGLDFYVPKPDEAPISGYLDRFVHEGAIPIGEEEADYLHDLSFHTGALALPYDLSLTMRANVKFSLRLLESLQNSLRSKGVPEPLIKEGGRHVKLGLTILIDNYTGLNSLLLIVAKNRYKLGDKEIATLISSVMEEMGEGHDKVKDSKELLENIMQRALNLRLPVGRKEVLTKSPSHHVFLSMLEGMRYLEGFKPSFRELLLDAVNAFESDWELESQSSEIKNFFPFKKQVISDQDVERTLERILNKAKDLEQTASEI